MRALFFAYFLLSQQKKVGRHAGARPGGLPPTAPHEPNGPDFRLNVRATHARPPRINCRFSISTLNTIANATQFIRIADPP